MQQDRTESPEDFRARILQADDTVQDVEVIGDAEADVMLAIGVQRVPQE